MAQAAARPSLEVARKQADGSYRIYVSAYRKPLRIWLLGRWIIGRPW